MQKIKVTILNQYFYPENITAASLPYELASGLVESGYEVKAVSGMPHEYYKHKTPKNETVSGISIERINYIYRNRSKKINRIINYFSFFVSILLNRSKLKNADVLITYSSPPINPIVPALFAKKYNYKMIYIVYDLYPDMAVKFGYLRGKSIATKLFSFANNYVFKQSDKIIVLSNEMKEYFASHNGFEEKIEVIPNWYSEQSLASTSLTVNRDRNELRVLYGGNIGIVQDIDTLSAGIVSAKNIKAIHFDFAAHGNRLDNLFKIFEEEKLSNVKKIGFMPKEDYDQYLNKVDLAIISIDPRVQGLASPSKYYSYISKGIPVLFIGPDGMDIAKEICQERIGYVVENGDTEKLRNIFLSLSRDKSELIDMGKRASKLFIKKYTAEHSVRKYEILIHEITKEIDCV